MRHVKWTGFLAACIAATSCSLALDLDALNAGTPVDSGAPPCTGNADCDDGVECTIDVCNEDGSCDNIPDNSVCEYLELCDPEEGCVSTGYECMEAADCDDGATCTADDCQNYVCVNEPILDACENEDPCIENESCDPEAVESDPATGCLPGNEMFCEPSADPCMEAACDSTTGLCADFLVATADNDADTYLDANCGGDDCDDEDGAIHPGAEEPCDGVDDDCDGLTDVKSIVGPIEIDSAAAISTPSVAAAADLRGVVWQRGADDAGAVMAAVVGGDGALIDEALDFTSEGGAGAVGRAPYIAAGAAEFWIVWVADGASTNPAATVIDLTADELGGTVTAGTPIPLGSGAATEVTLPRIAWDGAGSSWVAGFAAVGAGDSRTVELRPEDMHSAPATSTFAVSTETGSAVEGLSLAVLGADSFAVAYAREDDSSDGDLEVFAAEIELAADAWSNVAGFPLRISPADVVDEVDASFWPSLAATGGGSWVAAFVDTDPGTILESIPSDIALYDGGALSELVAAGSNFYREPDLAFDGARFGFLYLSRVGTSESLEFLTLDAAFAPPASPYSGTTIAFSMGEDDTSGARLVATSADRFAAVWVSREDDIDHLEYLDFEVCGAGE